MRHRSRSSSRNIIWPFSLMTGTSHRSERNRKIIISPNGISLRVSLWKLKSFIYTDLPVICFWFTTLYNLRSFFHDLFHMGSYLMPLFLINQFFFQRLRNGYFICQIKLEISYYIRLKPVFFWLSCKYILTTVSLNPWNILSLRDCSFYKLIISHFREQTSHVLQNKCFLFICIRSCSVAIIISKEWVLSASRPTVYKIIYFRLLFPWIYPPFY